MPLSSNRAQIGRIAIRRGPRHDEFAEPDGRVKSALYCHLEDAGMKLFALSTLLIAGAAALMGARPAMASTSQYTVTVDNGPNAGKYAAKADDIQCLHSKSQKILAATFSNMDPHTGNSGVRSGIRVYDPDAPGAKTGELSADFGTFVKQTARYMVTRIPITLTINGEGADIAGMGKTVDGVQIHISVSCAKVLQM